MAMLRHTVRTHTFVALHEQIIDLCLSTGSTDSAQTVSDNLSGLDQFLAQQRNEREQNARWITAGTGNEPRAGNFVAIDFGQPVDRVSEQIRGGVFVPIKFAVDRGVLNPKIGAEIDHARTG